MSIAVLITILLLIITKLLDATSTINAVQIAQQETNPFARKIMYHIGVKKGAWLVTFFAISIILSTGLFVLYSYSKR